MVNNKKGNDFTRTFNNLAPVVQRLDNAIQRISVNKTNHAIRWIVIYPVDSVIQPLNNRGQAPVVQRLDNAIHRINRYPVDKCRQNKTRYPLDSDLSGG